jgi:hypothetical protein
MRNSLLDVIVVDTTFHRIVITTNETYPWSFVTKIFRKKRNTLKSQCANLHTVPPADHTLYYLEALILKHAFQATLQCIPYKKS